jgi:hypothetical protein
MSGRKKAKLGIVMTALCVAMGALTACGDLPTASSGEHVYCVWIDNILHCAPT